MLPAEGDRAHAQPVQRGQFGQGGGRGDHDEGVRGEFVGARRSRAHAGQVSVGQRRDHVRRAQRPIEKFKNKGEDFVVATTLTGLVAGMNKLTGDNLIQLADLKRQIEARDREIDNPYSKDAQVMGIRNALSYTGDSLSRTAAIHRILDSSAGPLIAVRVNVLTRKTLGGLQTDLSGRVLDAAGNPVPGLYAAGEVAGFGGGGIHGYRSLEGTFLGGCLFSGRQAGRAAAAATAT
ncbi:FAD-binding protein [Streptomyces sp. NBC_01485]|uniref:FAD-binding protein n=1 Tax=Streptomyces sp. NBC_01485 TaxID=2903884 RepID=UPI002E333F14|nr:FAD-binding protein [Streptomyces sp. NBC_01485]